MMRNVVLAVVIGAGLIFANATSAEAETWTCKVWNEQTDDRYHTGVSSYSAEQSCQNLAESMADMLCSNGHESVNITWEVSTFNRMNPYRPNVMYRGDIQRSC
jgi:hypothetical protein